MSENYCFANRTLPPAIVFYLNQQHQQTNEVPRLAKPSLSVDYFMTRFSFGDEEFIGEEEEEEEKFANDVSASILDDEEIIEEEEEEDEEIYEEEEEENYNELVDHQDMSEYLETRTYYYDPVMDIDVNEGVVDDEEQETCAICLLEYQDEDTIGTLQCGHEFHAGCIKKWLQRKKACPFCRAPLLEILRGYPECLLIIISEFSKHPVPSHVSGVDSILTCAE
ncbi:E3 ubiquitin ligase BIG BROTHER-related-like [Lycium ferocissimum]|uniref:E3 ubiquitin ligase BIG BROTHER-related-like n=1 Tax=Lycium ferocissimum TaxID=112874 RepID=UPI002815CA10|nr:E3 ubiquitin ligase BIG BROTHER-related-like [Lycium ferocissimum]